MAKKKQAPAPPPPESRAQLSIINLKGTETYRDWLAAQSKRTHIPSASIVRLGLAMWAKANGCDPPPEK